VASQSGGLVFYICLLQIHGLAQNLSNPTNFEQQEEQQKIPLPYQREKLLASKGAIAYNTIYMVRVVVAITPYTFYSLF
jgi:hypothetical protein